MFNQEIEIDGQLISIQMPVSDVQQQDCKVSYQDATGRSEAEFSSPAIAKQFSQWLSSQP